MIEAVSAYLGLPTIQVLEDRRIEELQQKIELLEARLDKLEEKSNASEMPEEKSRVPPLKDFFSQANFDKHYRKDDK